MSYSTKQSRLINDFLKTNSQRHFSAEEIYFALISSNNKIGRTTVYRQLDRLVEMEVAKKFSVGDKDACCYQYNNSEHCHNHYHLKCSGCGRLIHTECEFMDKLSAHIFDDHQFIVDTSKTVLYGICNSCAKETLK